MGISSAVSTALSGLRAAQAGLDVVSQNVANAGTVGYTRRSLTTSQQVLAGQTTGVDIAGTTRTLNALVQKQLRLETAGAGYTGVKSDMLTGLDAVVDPTSGSNLSSLVDGFATAFQGLVNDPASYAVRSSVVSSAQGLASALRTASDGVTALRQEAEDGIGQSVSAANGLLKQIATVNAQVVQDPTSAALLDQRDGLIDQLSQYLDVKVTPAQNGSVSLATTGGLQLFDGVGATTLSFNAQTITPTSISSADTSKRTVGTITATGPTGVAQDLVQTGAIRSGKIAAYLEMRDEVLPQAQAQLDALAAGLAGAMSDTGVAGTAATSGAATGFDLDLSGLQAGNTFTLAYTENGTAKSVTFVKAGSAAAKAAATDGTATVGIDFSGGMGSVVSQVQAALGNGLAVSTTGGSTLRILDDGAAGTTNVTSLSGRATVSTLQSGSSELPLFVDGDSGAVYTGSFEGTSQRLGFASRIGVNAGVTADNSLLVKSSASTLAADTTRPSFLLARVLGDTVKTSGSVGIGGTGASFTGTLTQLASGLIATQASAANQAKSLDSGQQVALNAVQGRYSDTAGVNIDTELSQLIELQTAYTANARVISAGKDMLDMLLRIGG